MADGGWKNVLRWARLWKSLARQLRQDRDTLRLQLEACEACQLRAELARVTEGRDTALRQVENFVQVLDIYEADLADTRAETARLRERVEKVIRLWADFSSQEMYGETFSDGMEEQDYEAWCEALQALTSDPEPTT